MLPPDIPVASGSGMNGREATVEDEEMEAEEERYEGEPGKTGSLVICIGELMRYPVYSASAPYRGADF